MKKLFFAFMAVAAITLVGCKDKCEPQLKGRNLVVYGKIFTAENNAIVDAFAVENGKFVYVGDIAGAKKYEQRGFTVIDYTNKGLVIPGCTEGHGHFVGIDAIARMLPGFREPYKNLISSVIPQKMQTNPGPFISFGWSTTDVEKIGKNDYATEIEAVSQGYPVIMMDGGGHSAVCNRTALKMAGLIDENGHKLKDVRGGEVITIQGSDNIASGFLTDEAVMYVIEQSFGAPLDEAGYLQACQTSVAELNKRGFTSYMDAYINAFDDAEMYKYLAQMD
ncbi:MAG: amidohydrolase family protein, partial [Bacteroidales bacterium]|nr:amidohydrolase family protein [Candidatus Colicola coprequi]